MTRYLSALAASAAVAGSVLVSAQSATGPATAEQAHKFLVDANQDLLRLINEANRAGWVQSTYITPDTELLAARANELLVNASTRYAKEARRFDGLQLPESDRRQLEVLKNQLTMSAPPDPKDAEELTRLVASMEGAYGSGKYCPKDAKPDDCLDIEKVTEILAENRDPARLKEV